MKELEVCQSKKVKDGKDDQRRGALLLEIWGRAQSSMAALHSPHEEGDILFNLEALSSPSLGLVIK